MRRISRRDFLNGMALTVASGLTPAAQTGGGLGLKPVRQRVSVHHGWLGVYLDRGHVDWNELEDLLIHAYKLAAPKSAGSRGWRSLSMASLLSGRSAAGVPSAGGLRRQVHRHDQPWLQAAYRATPASARRPLSTCWKISMGMVLMPP